MEYSITLNLEENSHNQLRINKGLKPLGLTKDDFKESKRVNYDQLGDLFANNVDMSFFKDLLRD